LARRVPARRSGERVNEGALRWAITVPPLGGKWFTTGLCRAWEALSGGHRGCRRIETWNCRRFHVSEAVEAWNGRRFHVWWLRRVVRAVFGEPAWRGLTLVRPCQPRLLALTEV